MTLSSPQKAPIPVRRRVSVRASWSAAVLFAALVCGVWALGSDAFPPVLALATAWLLLAHEASNGRR
ncbi:hypothetical protein GCM10012320_30540 [Sinomonas cellulolyticus]|uniref:Uncharacterized protein n=1 Tax=Sinomonas cellulolyticus TaxID=2801916 RepID=A0ABS1JXL0_9MICC|nr:MULTISPECIES: hypothetical protein [Sinomonas]MBL0703903.1 hypothetical protein [Sinomonas cellulolyticus]GHG57525.1 hypothetical protein GCM10012320_30540 [Sinomonas sp. KCTC 49339]